MPQVEYTGAITPFGNLTFGSGLAAAFSGSDSKPQSGCARGVNQNSAANVIGGTPTDNAPRAWSGFRLFGPNASKLVEHDAAGTPRTLELRDEHNNLIAIATAADQTAQVWENMSFTAPAPFVSPRVVMQGTVGSSSDGMDVARLHLFYQDDGSAPPPPAPTTTPPPAPPPQGAGAPRDITLAFGQSHMEGPEAAQDRWAYYYAGACDNFPPDTLTWEPAVEPLSRVATTWFGASAGMGPAMPYIDERAKLVPGRRQGVLLRARGSTPLTDFAPGTGKYQQIVSDMLAAKNSSPAGSRFAGAICWQGESGPSNWDTVFLSIVSALRNDLSAPNLPFAFVVIDAAFSAGISQIQRTMSLPYGVARVTLDDLPSPGATDNLYPLVHRTVGKRLAWAILGMSTVAY